MAKKSANETYGIQSAVMEPEIERAALSVVDIDLTRHDTAIRTAELRKFSEQLARYFGQRIRVTIEPRG